jgi:hypothetical protein
LAQGGRKGIRDKVRAQHGTVSLLSKACFGSSDAAALTSYMRTKAVLPWRSSDEASNEERFCNRRRLSLCNFGIYLSLRAAPPHPRWTFLFSDIRCAGDPLAVAAPAGGAVS